MDLQIHVKSRIKIQIIRRLIFSYLPPNSKLAAFPSNEMEGNVMTRQRGIFVPFFQIWRGSSHYIDVPHHTTNHFEEAGDDGYQGCPAEDGAHFVITPLLSGATQDLASELGLFYNGLVGINRLSKCQVLRSCCPAPAMQPSAFRKFTVSYFFYIYNTFLFGISFYLRLRHEG